MNKSLYFWKVEKATGYCKIFRREKLASGKWIHRYCRSLGKAETHHLKLLRIESNDRARADLKKMARLQQAATRWIKTQ